MLHKLGYEFTCEGCEQPKRGEDFSEAIEDSCLCNDCWHKLGPEDQNYWYRKWEGTWA